MYIDTHTKDTIQKSIYQIFKVEDRELEELFIKAKKESYTGVFTDGDKLNSIFGEFIDIKMSNENIDKILFFHLGRRLNSAQSCKEGKNLFELLSTENPMSIFLKNNNVTFKQKDGHLDLYYKGQFISLEELNSSYLKWRFGHNSNSIDYCFNGFVFRDLLFKNNYARSLYEAPEFLSSLAEFLKHPTMKKTI